MESCVLLYRASFGATEALGLPSGAAFILAQLAKLTVGLGRNNVTYGYVWLSR